MAKLRISHSRIKSWLRCRRQHWYKYKRRLQARVKSKPLMLGSIIHDMLKAYHQRQDPWRELEKYKEQYQKLFLAEQEYYGDIIDNTRRLMELYFLKYSQDKIIHAEEKFEVPLTDDILITGQIDGIDKKRKLLLETKSSDKEPSEADYFINLQSSIYLDFVPRAGIVKKLEGTLWNLVRSKPPSKPELLKNGTMSKKNIDTTWKVYRQAVIDAGLDLDDYLDMKDKLVPKEDTFFKRVIIPYNPIMVRELVEEAKSAAKEIKRRGNNNQRTIDRHCAWCEYRDLCQAELLGEDTEHLLRTKYERRP